MRARSIFAFAVTVLVLGMAVQASAQGQVMNSDDIAKKLGIGSSQASPPSGVKTRQITVGPAASAPPAAQPAPAAPAMAPTPAPAAPVVQSAPPAAYAPSETAGSKKTKAPAAPAAPASGTVTLYVTFKSGSTDLANAQAKTQLDELGKTLAMPESASLTFEIGGHTDSVGNATYNQGLSQQRANYIKNYIVTSFGVAPGRLKAVGYGFNQPVASNDTEEGRAQNRRVVITRLN